MAHDEARRAAGGRFQFGLSRLLAAAFAVAVGLSVVDFRAPDWTAPVPAAAAALLALGLASQALDLRIALARRRDLSYEERWGVRFAVLGRLGVVLLLAVHYLTKCLAVHGFIELPEHPGDFRETGAALRESVFCLAAVLALSTSRGLVRKRAATWRSRLLGAAGWAAGGALAVVVWLDAAVIYMLVYVALIAIEAANGPRFMPEGLLPNVEARNAAFFNRSVTAAGAALVALALAWLLARQWRRGLAVRLLLGGLIAASACVAAGQVEWFCRGGLESLSPWLAEGHEAGPPHRWASAAVVVAALATVAACGIVRSGARASGGRVLDWRREPSRYYHERPGIAVLLALAVAAQIVAPAAPLLLAPFLPAQPPPNPWGPTAWDYLLTPMAMLRWAVVIQAARVVVAGLRGTEPAPFSPALTPGRFLAVWTATLVSVGLLVPAVVWLSFAFWLSPWRWLPWPR